MYLPRIVCEVLRGLAVTGFLCAAAPEAPLAADIYIDGGAATNGNGTIGSPYNRIHNVTFDNSACGNTYHIRGVHDSFDGRYFGNEWRITAICGAGNPLIIQAYNWTAVGTGEKVYLDGTRPPSSGWVQCQGAPGNCDSPCVGVPGTCTDVWHATDNGTVPSDFQSGTAIDRDVGWAQKPDGSMTFRVSSLSDLNNSHGWYNNKRCSAETWKPCLVDGDCFGAGACTATSDEVDSFINTSTSPKRLFVRWGGGSRQHPGNCPTCKFYVPYTAAGDAFAFRDNSAYATVRGFNMRCHRSATIWNNAGSTNNTIKDNRIFYGQTTWGNGDSYGIVFDHILNITIEDNEIAYTADEALHGRGRESSGGDPCAGIGQNTVLTIRRNFLHHNAGVAVMGEVNTTPHNIILEPHRCTGNSCPCPTGNWAGSVIEGNVLSNTQYGVVSFGNSSNIRFEETAAGTSGNPLIIRSNIFNASAQDGILLDGSDNFSEYIEIYNNLFVGSVRNGLNFYCSAPGGVRNNSIYNNTFVNAGAPPIAWESSSGGNCGGNIFRNNILYSSDGRQLVSWPVSGTFENNLLFPGGVGFGGTLVSFNGVNYTCGNITTLHSTLKCTDPLLVAPTGLDFHIQSASPAKNAGTATGMPAGRTADINNTIAATAGYSSYADNQAIQGGTWDIGADEYFETRPELLTDGTFESGAFGSGWNKAANCNCTVSGSHPQGAFSSAQAHLGTKSMSLVEQTTCFGLPISVPCDGWYQDLTGLTIGQNYTLSGWFTTTSALASTFLFAGMNPVISGLDTCGIAVNTGTVSQWQQFSCQIQFTVTNPRIWFGLSSYLASSAVVVYIDDVSLR